MKTVKETSVKVSNTPGAFADVNDLLSGGGVRLIAFSAQTDRDSAMLSFVSTEPEQAKGILEGAGYSPVTNDILVAEVPDHPGGFGTVLKTLKEAGVNIERIYTAVGPDLAGGRYILFLAVDNSERAIEALSSEWIRCRGEEIYTI